jgi:hypothetical protein
MFIDGWRSAGIGLGEARGGVEDWECYYLPVVWDNGESYDTERGFVSALLTFYQDEKTRKLIYRNVNRTMENGSSGFTYSPEGAWGFIKDDGTSAGNTTLLDDYLNSQELVARSDDGLVKRKLPANTSIAVTASTATMDLTFKGMFNFMRRGQG